MNFVILFLEEPIKNGNIRYFVQLGIITWNNSLIYSKFKSSSWLAQPFELQSIIYLYSPEQKDVCA